MIYEEIKPEAFQLIEHPRASNITEGPMTHMDEGLLYGIGFFETLCLLDGACFLKEHVKRINDSLAAFGIHRRLTEASLRTLIETHALRHTVLKIVITQNNALAITRANPYTESYYRDGFSLTQSAVTKSTNSAFIRHKSLNYGENLWARQAAKNAGYDDCLFANEFGKITESSVANLFIIEDGQLITPPLSDGLLPGIIRSKMIDYYPVRQESMSSERLMKCEGAFLTNCVVGVIRVSAYVGLKLPEHPMIEDIRNRLLEEARQSYAIKNR